MKLIAREFEAWLWNGMFYVRRIAHDGSHDVHVMACFREQSDPEEDSNIFNQIVAAQL